MIKKTGLILLAAAMALVVLPPPAMAQDASGIEVELRNAFIRDGGPEMPFGEPGAATVGPGVEFEPFGPYDIDISADGTLTMAWDDAEQWDQFERVLEAGFADKYYYQFDRDVIAVTADASANLVPTVAKNGLNGIIVEFGEGDEVRDGQIATVNITFGDAATTELAVTGAETPLLAIAGGTAVVAGTMLMALRRRILS